MKKLTKITAQKIHAKTRFKQHYPNVTSITKEELHKLIKSGSSQIKTVYKCSKRLSVKTYVSKNNPLYFVYNNNTHVIVTFLTEKQVMNDLKQIKETEYRECLLDQEITKKIREKNER